MQSGQKKVYIVKTVNGEFCWDDIDRAEVDIFRWENGGYEPKSFGQAVWHNDNDLRIKLTCFEKEPLITKRNFMDAVCEDSCLEFFFSLDSSKPDVYVNLEANAGGAALMNINSKLGTVEKKSLDKILGYVPFYSPEILDDRWSIEFHLTREELKKIFPDVEVKKGLEFSANIYKCGDKTDIPHFGMWNYVGTDSPSFHQPAYFGKLIID